MSYDLQLDLVDQVGALHQEYRERAVATKLFLRQLPQGPQLYARDVVEEGLMKTLRNGEKPTRPPEAYGWKLTWLAPIHRFVNNISDGRSDEAFAYLDSLIGFHFPDGAEYRALEHLALVKSEAAWLLTLGPVKRGVPLTRNQRRVGQPVGNPPAPQIADRPHPGHGDHHSPRCHRHFVLNNRV